VDFVKQLLDFVLLYRIERQKPEFTLKEQQKKPPPIPQTICFSHFRVTQKQFDVSALVLMGNG